MKVRFKVAEVKLHDFFIFILHVFFVSLNSKLKNVKLYGYEPLPPYTRKEESANFVIVQYYRLSIPFLNLANKF